MKFFNHGTLRTITLIALLIIVSCGLIFSTVACDFSAIGSIFDNIFPDKDNNQDGDIVGDKDDTPSIGGDSSNLPDNDTDNDSSGVPSGSADPSRPSRYTYEIAVVTDPGPLMDGGFNQGTYEGVENYAQSHGLSYNYYQPANGSDATDNDYVVAMRQAINNGAEIVVAIGYLQANALSIVAQEHPEVKFIFVDGWLLTDDIFGYGNILDNVTTIVYKEHESGFMAGYAAVMDGYTKLGGTVGGGGYNPACNRYAYGYVQGINAAAQELNVNVNVKISFKYGDVFYSSPELQSQIEGWYNDGTEVVFACGGGLFSSVKAAAELTIDGKIIGIDVDQSGLSDRVITSAVKGLSVSVEKVLGQIYNDEWNDTLGGKCQILGASDNATGISYSTSRFNNFTEAQYQELLNAIKSGAIEIKSEVADDINVVGWWNEKFSNSNVDVILDL